MVALFPGRSFDEGQVMLLGRTSDVVPTRILTCNPTYNSKCMKTKSLRISPEARRVDLMFKK